MENRERLPLFPLFVVLLLCGVVGWVVKVDPTVAQTFADGTVALPGIAFDQDTDCGLYRVSANSPAITAGGTKVLQATPSGITITGNISLGTAGNGLFVKSGTNCYMGTLTLNGATEVVTTNTKVTASSAIIYAPHTVGGTPLGVAYTSSRTAGYGFGTKGAAGDTSLLDYVIVEAQ